MKSRKCGTFPPLIKRVMVNISLNKNYYLIKIIGQGVLGASGSNDPDKNSLVHA